METAKPAPFVLISLVSTNDAQHLINCLPCLARGAYQNFAIYINENGGNPGFEKTRAALAASEQLTPGPVEANSAEFTLQPGGQRVHLANAGGNLGYAGGTNAALRQQVITDWDAVWVLNPDTFPEERALAALVERQREGHYGIVGSRLIFTASGLVQTWGGLTWNIWFGRGNYFGYLRKPDEVPDIGAIEQRMDFVCGASMYVTREYCNEIGGMDEDFFVYCEELDWCLRRGAYKLGYAHESVVHHVHGGTAGASRIRKQRSRFSIYFSERNKVLLMRKHLGRAAPIAAMLSLLTIGEQLVRTRSLEQFTTGMRGWWAGLMGETGFQKI